MGQYKFKLQKLLDIRMDKEEESKIQFKEAQREKQQVEDQLDALKESYAKYSQVDREKTIIEQKIRQNYLNAVSININQTDSLLQNKTLIVEEKREALKQRQIERKTVEVLKEKQQKAFWKEEEQIEQRNIDELALYAFVRNLERR